MGIVNRRNAVLGWTAWQMAKRVMKRKARRAVPAIDTSSKRPNRSAILVALAAVAAVLWFWRKQTDGDGESFG